VTTFTLGEIASRIAGSAVGDAACVITGIRPLDQAGPRDLSFLAHPRYRQAAAECRAAALLVRPTERLPGRNLILVENPYTALAAVMELFHPPRRPTPGVSPDAVVEEGVVLGRGVSIGPLAVVSRGSTLGDGVVLGPGVVLGEGVAVGRDTVLHPGVVVYPGCRVGDRVIIHAGAVVGSDGFGFGEAEGGRAKIPQVGIVRIEDDVEIGAGVTIDRATFGETVIGKGARIDNLVQIGHNVVVGEGSVLVAQTGIAGSTRLGRSVIMAGQSGAAGHLSLGDGTIVGAKSAVLKDTAPGSFVLGHPAVDHREWKRAQAALLRLPDLLRRVNKLEATLEAGSADRPARRRGRGKAGAHRRGRHT
jgi:UDP-3-O-[3-hydroxymyristoyl] glucosamine N-acyltransferase